MSGIALQGARCRACRSAVLQSFVAITGVAIPSPIHRQPVSYAGLPLSRRSIPLANARPFTSINSANSSITKSSQGEASLENKEETSGEANFKEQEKPSEEASSKNKEETSEGASHVPWYLQEESQDAVDTHSPGQKQQLIPPLPENPPPILDGLLQYLSVDAGLDDLALIDLRGVYPPPALGANLIMIVATARAVKHLNVAADRLCRWLRSNHKLRPVADGLLGRNELKIKLRRRARKAKLATSVGRTLDLRDDGITTGWICVNVGGVENGKMSQDTKPDPNFVGFKDTNNDVRIVVQMVMEGKRAELDLEGLWDNETRKEPKKEENPAWAQLDKQKNEEVRFGFTPGVADNGPSNRDHSVTFRPRTGPSYGQRRDLHTHSALQSERQPAAHENDGTTFPQEIFGSRKNANPPHSSLNATTPSTNIPTLFQQLSQLPDEEARRELGHGPQDKGSTLFLRLFYQSLSDSQAETEFTQRVELIRTAVALQHPEYTKTDLFQAFKDLAASGCEIPEDQALQTVHTLLSSQQAEDSSSELKNPMPNPNIDLALKVLDHMSLRGVDIFTPDVFLMLYETAGFQTHVRPISEVAEGHTPFDIENVVRVSPEVWRMTRSVQDRLKLVRASAGVNFGLNEYLSLLRIHFHHGDFDEFWKRWCRIPLMQVPRSKEHYMLLFRLHVELGNQSRAISCLSSWVPMMTREEPPVELDADLSEIIMACLLVADPTIKQKASEGLHGEFTALWKRCFEILTAGQNSG